MSKMVSVGGRNFFCELTDYAVRVRWQETILIQDSSGIAVSGPTRVSCLMKRLDCPSSCKYLGGRIDPESAVV